MFILDSQALSGKMLVNREGSGFKKYSLLKTGGVYVLRNDFPKVHIVAYDIRIAITV